MAKDAITMFKEAAAQLQREEMCIRDSGTACRHRFADHPDGGVLVELVVGVHLFFDSQMPQQESRRAGIFQWTSGGFHPAGN